MWALGQRATQAEVHYEMTSFYLGMQGHTQRQCLKSVVGMQKPMYLTLPFSPHQEQEPNLEATDPPPTSPDGE